MVVNADTHSGSNGSVWRIGAGGVLRSKWNSHITRLPQVPGVTLGEKSGKMVRARSSGNPSEALPARHDRICVCELIAVAICRRPA